MSFIVAIDGPAGTGKGTMASRLSKKYNLVNIDTGATYRCVTLEMMNQNIGMDEEEKIAEMLKSIQIELSTEKGKQKVFLNGQDVTDKIRSKEVSANVSPVSSIKQVRLAMGGLQRKMAQGKDVIMEGRDIGTVIFPNADVNTKIISTISIIIFTTPTIIGPADKVPANPILSLFFISSACFNILLFLSIIAFGCL